MTSTTPPGEHPRAAPIESATGTSLDVWTRRLDEAGGRELDHAGLARLLAARWGVEEWWAQSITVAYEQLIGRRVAGQSSAGDFSASASRTVDGDIDAVRAAWDAFMTPQRRQELGLGEPGLTDTATWRYWRAAVDDGTRVSVNITAKDSSRDGGPRSVLAIEHTGIATADGRDTWKAAWKAALTDFRKETR